MPKTEPGLRVRQLRPDELTPSDLQAWSALEARAAEPNAFLSPHFVLPALRYLDPGLRPIMLVVERDSGSGPEMLALGVFSAVAASRVCPLPHLVGYCSRHSYAGGVLVDRDHAPEAIAAMCALALGGRFGRQALVFPKAQTDGPLASILEERARAAGLVVQRVAARPRSTIRPVAAGREALRKTLGHRFKKVERQKRRLSETGELSWHCLRQGVDEATAETFLRLEHQGWKADNKSSLRANPADEAFFKQVVSGFASDSRALFTELRVGGQAIGSTSNFVSGGVGFAFKVGWDIEWRKYSPGFLNEVEFVRAMAEVCADLAWFDSGAGPESYIDQLWPERRELATLIVPLTPVAGLSLRLLARLRPLFRRFRPERSTVEKTDVADMDPRQD